MINRWDMYMTYTRIFTFFSFRSVARFFLGIAPKSSKRAFKFHLNNDTASLHRRQLANYTLSLYITVIRFYLICIRFAWVVMTERGRNVRFGARVVIASSILSCGPVQSARFFSWQWRVRWGLSGASWSYIVSNHWSQLIWRLHLLSTASTPR